MKIVVVGAGYVGLSNAVVLAAANDVTVVDIDAARVDLIARRISPIVDDELSERLLTADLHLTATTDAAGALAGADVVIIATPTDYDPDTNFFNTQSVESVIERAIAAAPDATVVIKSTIPVGFTQRMRDAHPGAHILFSPEFLREGRALHDNLHPSRIIVGDTGERGRAFADLMVAGAEDDDVPVLLTRSTEAEAIKLFANTYLALRVAYFNELDSYAIRHGLDAAQIIEGVGLDPRIGTHYNNPSFGYGGYCLPKDTKQLLANFDDVPQNLIGAVVSANATRMDFIASDILRRSPKTVGIHRLVMKSGSDNFRASAIQGVMERLRAAGIELLIHEPTIEGTEFEGVELEHDLDAFKRRSDVIIANRKSDDLDDVAERLYSRDIYGRD